MSTFYGNTGAYGHIYADIPVRYTCAKCGTEIKSIIKRSRQDEGMAVSAFLESPEAAEGMAVRTAALRGNKNMAGDLLALETTQAKHTCPRCAIINMADAGCPRTKKIKDTSIKMTLILFLTPMLGALAVFIIAAALLLDWNSSGPIPLSVILPALIFFVGSIVAEVMWVRRRSEKAYSDPALMERLAGIVLNKKMYADLSSFGYEDVLLGKSEPAERLVRIADSEPADGPDESKAAPIGSKVAPGDRLSGAEMDLLLGDLDISSRDLAVMESLSGMQPTAFAATDMVRRMARAMNAEHHDNKYGAVAEALRSTGRIAPDDLGTCVFAVKRKLDGLADDEDGREERARLLEKLEAMKEPESDNAPETEKED